MLERLRRVPRVCVWVHNCGEEKTIDSVEIYYLLLFIEEKLCYEFVKFDCFIVIKFKIFTFELMISNWQSESGRGLVYSILILTRSSSDKIGCTPLKILNRTEES